MGNPLVSRDFPTSLLVDSHLSQPSQESHNTSPPITHFNTFSTHSLCYPNHLPFGDSLPVPKPDSHFWISFCNIGGFPAIARNNKKVLNINIFIVSNYLDLFSTCKSNLNWHSLPNQILLHEWFCTANSCHTFHMLITFTKILASFNTEHLLVSCWPRYLPYLLF